MTARNWRITGLLFLGWILPLIVLISALGQISSCKRMPDAPAETPAPEAAVLPSWLVGTWLEDRYQIQIGFLPQGAAVIWRYEATGPVSHDLRLIGTEADRMHFSDGRERIMILATGPEDVRFGECMDVNGPKLKWPPLPLRKLTEEVLRRHITMPLKPE